MPLEIKYYSSGEIKYIRTYFDNGSLSCEEIYDINGNWFNLNNTAGVWYNQNGKITRKMYGVDSYIYYFSRLFWLNNIKNI